MSMGWTSRGALATALGLLCVSLLANAVNASYVGVVYGYTENGPSPQQAVELLRANGINQVRTYDTNPVVLAAFSNTTLEVIVGVTNEELPIVGASNVTAANWVKSNLLPFTPWLNITAIAVGSEVLTSSGANLSSMLVPAMRYIYEGLVSAGLDSRIKISTPHNEGVLERSFPPSQGTFNETFLPVILPMLNFLVVTNSFLMLNLYPYFSYQADSQVIILEYATFEPNAGVEDTYTNSRYYSLYDALLDATYAAMKAFNFSDLPILVSETGWPSAGDPDEFGPSIANAEAYNGNLAKRVYNKTGTPQKPNEVSSAYIYELFNEDSRTGPLSERSWGLFYSNTTPVYAIDLTGTGRDTVGNSTVSNAWCVAKSGVTDPAALQEALDFACGEGQANCSAIQSNGTCWLPNTIHSHASFAMNAYFQKEGDLQASCDFKGLATVTYVDPSYGSCEYFVNATAEFNPDGQNDGSSASVLLVGNSIFTSVVSLLFLIFTGGVTLRRRFIILEAGGILSADSFLLS